MRYGEVVGFEPIVSVVQLTSADEAEQARRLVSSFVISHHMADQLARVVLPQLVFGHPDAKGILIVGNYGTGKSHLMSVVSSVAEHADLAPALTHPLVTSAAAPVAGKYMVARVEIGAVTRGLRDILVEEIELALERWGVGFRFPKADAITNHKDAVAHAVRALQQVHPNKGLLLAVDELLDYLRTRDERELILDLGFLRELGEVAQDTDFRFIGGLQESLFDSPTFAFVAQPLNRVRDRFEQVRIARDDVNFVVARRLLPKTDEQVARVVEHLRPFTPVYGDLAERIDDYARLFPVHPAYVETFEQVKVAEKREVLRTLSAAIARVIDQEVPPDRPGLIAYDQYWSVIGDNPAMRSLPNVRDVVEKSGVLESRIKASYTRPALKDMALRIVHGLSVLRLTTDDVTAPLGATPEELRDNLALWAPTPVKEAGFLADQVRVALREISRTVSGQYISHNEANDQYYIDIKKDIDFDAKIGDRGEFMSDADLNRYFFDALRQVMGLSESTYTNVSRLWFFQVPWVARKVTRPGYLFFTAPDQRTTAQPPRDFYLYLLPPFGDREWTGATEPDEVVFRLAGAGEEFADLVRRYGGARAMANESSSHRDVFAQKADDALRRLRNWLADHLVDHLQVTYRGVTESIGQTMTKASSSASVDILDLVRSAAATKLAPLFAERYPDYPGFPRLNQPVTEESRAATAAEGVRMVARWVRTNQAIAVLDGLRLLDQEGNLRPLGSGYAKAILDRLEAKPGNQVLNRGELIEPVSLDVTPVEKDVLFRMEPEWVAVVLVALAHGGHLAIKLDDGETLEAGNIERAALVGIEKLANFQFLRRPKGLPVGLWEQISEVLRVNPALVRDESTRERAVVDIQADVDRQLARTAALEDAINRGLKLWNAPVFTDTFTLEAERGAVVGSNLPDVVLTSTDAKANLRAYKGLLERLRRHDTVGKLRNLDLSDPQVVELREVRGQVDRVDRLVELVARLQPVTAYLAEAQGNMPAEHHWSADAMKVRDAVIDEVRRIGGGQGSRSAANLAADLDAIKHAYVAAYADEHQRLTLGPAADDRRASLARDERYTALKTINNVELMDRAKLSAWSVALTQLPTCRQFHQGLLDASPTCPNCGLRPSQSRRAAPAEQSLELLDRRLDEMLVEARRVLKRELASDTVAMSLAAMTAEERRPIDDFLGQPDDANDVPDGFVQSATAALRGIQTVTIAQADIVTALQRGGYPTTRADIERRLKEFLDEVMRGKDRNTTRLSLAEPTREA